MLLWIPIGLVAYFAYCAIHRRHMTREHEEVLEKALVSTNPAVIAKVADVFAGEGYPEAARVLRARASIQSQPGSERQADYRSALASQSPSDVRAIALQYAKKGQTFTARHLVNYADGLKKAQEIQPVVDVGEQMESPQMSYEPLHETEEEEDYS